MLKEKMNCPHKGQTMLHERKTETTTRKDNFEIWIKNKNKKKKKTTKHGQNIFEKWALTVNLLIRKREWNPS